MYQQTVELAVGYLLPSALAARNPSYNLMPIITCQKKPLGDAYVETNNNSTNPFSANASPLTGSAAITPTLTGTSTGSSSTSTSTTTSSHSRAMSNVMSNGGVVRLLVGVLAVAGGAMLLV